MSAFNQPKVNLLHEIAKRANVSHTTVSRVLNGKTKGAYGKTLKRHEQIRQIADELDYRPSFHARSFQRGRTQNVALLYDTRRTMLGGMVGGYGEMIAAVAQTLQQRRHHLTLWGLEPDDLQRTDLLLDRRFDGVLVHHEVTPALHTAIERAGVPAVLLNGLDDRLPCFLPDERASGAALTEHLLGLGHRRIALVRLAPDATHVSQELRETGYRRSMQDAGLEPIVMEVGFADDAVTPAILDHPARPTAAITVRGTHAVHATVAFREAGIDLPGRLSLATFGVATQAPFTHPALTTVEVPFDTLGEAGANRLLDLIDLQADEIAEPGDAGVDDRLQSNLTVSARLVVRASTVPVS